MSYIAAIWIVWAALALLLLALIGYRATVTRGEEDLLFLEGGSEMRHQREIAARLNRIKPVIRILGGVEGAVTIALVALYLMDALHQF